MILLLFALGNVEATGIKSIRLARSAVIARQAMSVALSKNCQSTAVFATDVFNRLQAPCCSLADASDVSQYIAAVHDQTRPSPSLGSQCWLF